MVPKQLGKLHFSVKSVLILILGMAVGYSLNLRTLQLLTGLAAYPRSPSPYVIEPPDILRVDIAGNTGKYLVGPDGRINLGRFGQLNVAGKTIDEAHLAIKQLVSQGNGSPQILVDVFATNSKVYYIVSQGRGTGDTVTQFPITGNETVLDAIAQIGGLNAPNVVQICIVRPPRDGIGAEKKLLIEWNKIVQGISTNTNYQVLPGDRVVISRKPVRAPAN